MRGYYTCATCGKTAHYFGSPIWARRCMYCGYPLGRRRGRVSNISTTVKRIYLDRVLSGKKKCELKANSKYWKSRLENLMMPMSKGDCFLTYLCGRDIAKFEVLGVRYLLKAVDIDGIHHRTHWRIDIGPRVCLREDEPCIHRRHAATNDGLDLWRCTSTDYCHGGRH